MLSKTGNLLKKIVFQIGHKSIYAVEVAMMLMVFLVAVDVTLRRVFNSPLSFSLELMGFGLVIVVWTSILYSTAQERHISVDVLVARFPEKVRGFFTKAFDLVSALILLLIGWQGFVYAIKERAQHHESPMLDVPLYPFVFIVALGALLAGIMVLINFIDSVRKGKKR